MPKTAAELLRSTHLSYSKLRTYLQCPHRFKLEYLDGCKSLPSREIQLGSVVHAMLAAYLEGIQGKPRMFEPELDDVLAHFESVCRSLKSEGELTERLSEGDVAEMIAGFTIAMPRIDGRSIMHVEAEKRTKLGSYQLLSILDLVLTNERRDIHIIDFKTGNPKYVEEEQLRTYSLPILGSTGHNGTPVKLSYVFLRDGTIRSSSMHPRECDALVKHILGIVRVIEADTDFEPNVTRLCDWCGVRGSCSAYRRSRR